MPNTTGSENQILKTDGSGNLSWTDQSGGGGGGSKGQKGQKGAAGTNGTNGTNGSKGQKGLDGDIKYNNAFFNQNQDITLFWEDNRASKKIYSNRSRTCSFSF